MTDYISREAAVVAVCRRCNYAFPEDEPCGDCLAKTAIMAVPAADVEPVRHGRWIPCSERLPGEKQRVLFFVQSNETIYAGFYNYTGKRGTAWFRAGKSDYASKYWMPLPEPPKVSAIAASAVTNLRTCAIWMEATRMDNDRRRALADGLFILLAAIMLLVVFCAAWSHYDRLGWVRFVSALPCPGWVKTILWGWS